MKAQDVTPGDVVQIVVHGALFPRVVAWLGSQGIEVSAMPGDDDDLPTFVAVPGRALWEASR